jgi:protease IV
MPPTQKTVTRKKALFFIIIIGIIAFVAGFFLSGNTAYYETVYDDDYEDCNVAAIAINGYLNASYTDQTTEQENAITYSEDVVPFLETFDGDKNMKAVMLYIDSSGGDGVAGEEIANALKSLTKPNVAVIRTIGASAAYWAASGADKIYASKISDVGGIGFTASYLDETGLNNKEGYKYIELTSAKYKDLWDPNRPISKEERNIIKADLEQIHNVFVEQIAENRNLPIEKVAELANGLSYTGIDALEYGLIDEIGDMRTAKDYIEELIGEDAEFCWY